MADAAPTQASARSLMAGYADSAVDKHAAKLRRELGSRTETFEAGFSTFLTQLQSVDSKTERRHSELLKHSKGQMMPGRQGQVATAATVIAAENPSAAATAAVVTTATVTAAATGTAVKLAGHVAEAGRSCWPVLGQWEEAARNCPWTTSGAQLPQQGYC